MSKQLTDLCTLLVGDLLGGLVADVFATIVTHYRISAPEISQFLEVPIRHVDNALIILIQHCLVFHDDDEKLEVYEANLEAAYSLLRSGRNVHLIGENIGIEGSQIFSDLRLHGSTPLSDHVQSWSIRKFHVGSQEEHTQTNGNVIANGLDAGRDKPVSQQAVESYRAFAEMASTQAVRKVSDNDFTTEADLTAMTEHTLGEEEHPGYKAKSGSRRIAFIREVKKRKRTARNDLSLKYKVEHVEDMPIEISEDRKPKKRKLNKDHPVQPEPQNQEDAENGRYARLLEKFLASAAEKPILSIRPDQQRLDVLARSQVLADVATRFLGSTAGKVYRALLHLTDREHYRCYDPYESDEEDEEDESDEEDEAKQDKENKLGTIWMSTSKIAELLPNDFDTDRDTNTAKGKKGGHSAGDTSVVNGNAHPVINGNTKAATTTTKRKHKRAESPGKLALVEEYLQILASHSNPFVEHRPRPPKSSLGQDMWSVPFGELSRELVLDHLTSTILSLFGRTAARLIRILVDKGKLDEKQLSTIALVPQRNVRELLNQMQTAGFVGVQEVPRENSRQPSRTIYLWFFDAERTCQLVLDDTYKTMARFLQRRNAERQKYSSVIEKSERTDVEGNEAKFLSKPEQSALKEWRDKETKIYVQLQRLDDGVLVLRDLLPPNALHDGE